MLLETIFYNYTIKIVFSIETISMFQQFCIFSKINSYVDNVLITNN